MVGGLKEGVSGEQNECSRQVCKKELTVRSLKWLQEGICRTEIMQQVGLQSGPSDR